MTTLDNTVLSDRTTATAVSSAEDSNAAKFREHDIRRMVHLGNEKHTIPRTVNDLRVIGLQAMRATRLIRV